MRIVVTSQSGERAMLVIYIALDMQVPAYLNCSVAAELKKAATLVDKPKLSGGYHWWHLLVWKAPANYNALLHITFLWSKDYLIAGAERADHSPSASNPLW
jgi:hypothetical protein